MVTDKHGKEVKVGSKVRVLHIDPVITEFLDPDEAATVNSMLNKVLEVYKLTESGYAYVLNEWERGEDLIESHSIPLGPNEMELIHKEPHGVGPR